MTAVNYPSPYDGERVAWWNNREGRGEAVYWIVQTSDGQLWQCDHGGCIECDPATIEADLLEWCACVKQPGETAEECRADLGDMQGSIPVLAPRSDRRTVDHIGYVRTDSGKYLVQRPADNDWGFELCDDDQSWPGGSGIAASWEAIPAAKVPADIRAALDWVLEASTPRSERCSTCGGTGQRGTARSADGTELERHERSGTPCDTCQGTGRVIAADSVEHVT